MNAMSEWDFYTTGAGVCVVTADGYIDGRTGHSTTQTHYGRENGRPRACLLNAAGVGVRLSKVGGLLLFLHVTD